MGTTPTTLHPATTERETIDVIKPIPLRSKVKMAMSKQHKTEQPAGNSQSVRFYVVCCSLVSKG
ncbi:hypothetical protein DPMN_049122 [Dreissena polymorpha]|uniref:Uncharacterized protein n=1 Tax=Dreissena polymorpha TaxID=45954 RepID=A0A9D4DC38_DREPO|nr:hypothetical protein DPMN_049122 [Dreissena polymorpha]